MGQYQDEIKKVGPPSVELRERLPEVYEGLATTYRAVYKDGALSAATKELMAVAIAVSQGCTGCIASHARGAARKGATEEQMAETIGVTIQMGGGPASVYGPEAWEAFKEFRERYR
ncbi:MAG: carboxymuconolactone decarboxylase family protein [Actinomycetota bacterium]|nr:carboxymuconolactone decarboxylase family protein [Actinomycetota bacterium]